MADAPKVKRDYLAKKWFQLRFALVYLALVTAGSAAMAGVLLPRLRRAIGLEMYRGHSKVMNTWELLREQVLRTDFVATAIVVLLAAAVTLIALAAVHRASHRIGRDLRAARTGADPAAWEPIARPREFRHLQKLLAGGIRCHRAHLAEMDELCAAILEGVRAARSSPPGCRDLRALHVLCERLRNHARHIRVE